MKTKVTDICTQAVNGKIGVDAFYDRLSAVAEDTRTSDDLAALIEDVLMDLEMESGSGAKKGAAKMIKEMAQGILDNLDRVE